MDEFDQEPRRARLNARGPAALDPGNGVADGALTVERLVSGLRREVGAGLGRRGAAGRINIRLEAAAARSGRLDIESNRADQ